MTNKELRHKYLWNWKTITVFILFCIFMVTAEKIIKVPLISLLFFGLLIAFFVYTNLAILSGKRQVMVYLTLLLAKMTALFYNSSTNAIPMSYWDAVNFNRYALQILYKSTGLFDMLMINGYDFFVKFVALNYYIFGIHPQMFYFYMFICSLVIFTFIYLTAYELTGDRKKSQIAAFLFMVWPLEFLQSVTFLREMPIQCLLIISVYGFVKYIKNKQASGLVLALIFSVLSGLMHQGMLFVPLIYLFIAFIYSELLEGRLNPKKTALFIIIFTVMVAAFLAFIFSTRISPTEGINEYLIRSNALRGNTCYIQTVPHNLLELLQQMPTRLLMFVMAPFPWQIFNLQTFLAWLFDGLLRLFIMYRLVLFYVRFRPRNNAEKSLLLTAGLIIVGCYVLYSIGTFTYGTAMRHRTKVFPIEIIIIYPCYELMKEKLKNLTRPKQDPGTVT